VAGCGNNPSGSEQTSVITPAANSRSESTDYTPGNLEGEITVSCYESITYRDFLEMAAQSFEAKYTGTKVNIDAPSQMPNIR
jgi:ABC-type glycerol-3-phosphate transport system substrate-binding protein